MQMTFGAKQTALPQCEGADTKFPAPRSPTIFTNERGHLLSAINERAGQVQTVIAQAAMPTPAADEAAGAGMGCAFAAKNIHCAVYRRRASKLMG